MKHHTRVEAGAMRRVDRWSSCRAVLSVVAITAAACGHGSRSSPPDAAPATVLGPHTHVVPPELLTAVMVEADQLVFAQSDVTAAGWQPGDILVGDFAAGSTANPVGFLRRVISIEDDGDRAILHTEQAALTDAIASGDLEQVFRFEPESDVAARTSAPAQLAAGDGVLAIGPFGMHSLKIELEKKGDPDIKASGTFGIEELSASLGLQLDVGLHIAGFSVTSAHAIVSGDAAAELVPFAELEMELVSKTDIRSRLDFDSWLADPALQTTPFEIEFPDRKTKPHTVFIGELPVVISGVAKASVSCTVNLSTKLEAKADISFHGTARAGFTYSDGVGTGILDGSATGTVIPTYQPSAGGSFECQILVQFGLELYEAIDALIGFKPYAKAEATLRPQCLGTNFVPNPQGTDELTYGVNTTYSVEVSNFLKFLGLKLAISLPEQPWGVPGKLTLGELGPPVGGDHCPCGAVDEPCCDTSVVTGATCDPGLTCAPSGLCEGTPIFDAGPDAPPDAPPDVIPPPPDTVGTSLGDPHLMTFDRVRYDAQAVGELILAHDTADGTVIQVRTRALTGGRVAVNVAVAATVGTDVVAFYGGSNARLDHVLTDFPQGKTTLNGGDLHRTGNVYTIVWPDNSQLRIANGGVRFFVADGRRSRMEGLLGNFDSSPLNEIVTRTGTALAAPISFTDFYHTYLESWRISQAESLFDYGPGETTETFTDRSFPPGPATTQSLSDADRASASAICQAAGVAADWFDACVLDVALTGTADAAGELAGAPPSDTSIDTTGGDVTPPTGGGVPPGTCVATGTMLAPRLGFEARAVTLSNGKVLIAGGLDTSTGHVLAEAEVYDPATGVFTSAGSMSRPRIRFAAVPLGNGKILAAGGINDAGTVEASADIYDPVQNTWVATANMAAARVDVSGATLPDGHALVIAGAGQIAAFNRSTGVVTLSTALKTAEIYDPHSAAFSATGDTAVAGTTMFAVSRRLDGNVFAATATSGEIYTTATGHFVSLGALPTTIDGAGVFAFTLGSGAVFALPALGLADSLAGASVGGPVLVDPMTNRFSSLTNDTIGGTSAAILLATGDVFVVGGQHAGAATAATQVYQVASATWQTPGATSVVRHGPVLANLPDGAVLVMGGCQANTCGNTVLATAEICNPLLPSPPPPPASRPARRASGAASRGPAILDSAE